MPDQAVGHTYIFAPTVASPATSKTRTATLFEVDYETVWVLDDAHHFVTDRLN